MIAEVAAQPLLHDLVPAVAAPSCLLSGRDGQIRASGVQGLFHADRRVLSEAVLRVDGREPESLGYAPAGPGAVRFTGLLRHIAGPTPDPAVRVDRVRHLQPTAMTEEIRISSAARTPVTATVTLDLASDNALVERVKGGAAEPPEDAALAFDGLAWPDGITVTAPAAAVTATPSQLSWPVTLAPGETVTLHWRLDVRRGNAVVAAPDHPAEWARPHVRADDRRLVRLLDQALDDLQSLRLTDDPATGDTFLGAGVPWYLTLFGRDSIWAARMLLPLGTDLAAGTLRALARRQGRRVDPSTAEAPGKIIHEIRQQSIGLPASYYGTIDATPLWISLLHDAWRWGMPTEQVAALLPHLEAALGWLDQHADPDGDGFLEYIDHTGRGLANQGWKDSADAVRYHDGRIAPAPIALCEVQGYAHAAALHGAALLDAFDRPGADRWRDYAHQMATRFRAHFWTPGGYPALALDGDKGQVDSVTSNIGHLLGTGLLNPDEEKAIAERLVAPDMANGYGLRTMSAHNAGYAPLSYHCGSVWPHDTAIGMLGLARAGHGDAAAILAEGLLRAAEAFDYRLPELYAGDSATDTRRPLPYPAACHPQAWGAAAAVTLLHTMLGLDPDIPNGRIRLTPPPGAPLGAIRADGIRIAGQSVTVTVEPGAKPTISGLVGGIQTPDAMASRQE
ncbi:amylo-alpha-1,6-glucosidase [Actinoplanes sp. CA-030573]|uniref:amylo-alpha-1,6-glucosidase n=1 Tax=Actinoplanes sp. CA-030573 TaxID=3239898 RepID=UPI003D91BEDA